MRKNLLKTRLAKTVLICALLATHLQAQRIVSVSATNREASKPAAYIFEVTFDSPVRPDSQLDITFPAAFNTTMVMMAVSDNMDGNLKATVNDNVVTLTRHNAESTIAAGDTIDIKLASILNPNQADNEWDFEITLKDGATETSTQKLRSRVELFTKK